MGNISHDGFPGERSKVIKAKYPNSTVGVNGENVAYNMDSGDGTAIGNALYTQWEGSPGHKKNMVSADFKVVGNGVFVKDRRNYGTQLFGSSNGAGGFRAEVICTSVKKEGDRKASSAVCVKVK